MCGLFGYIAQDKNQLDMETFLHLGCENDSRGGDSVGIFIDKFTEYGVDKTKLFSNFFADSKLLEHTRSVHIAVGHTRKASVGVVGVQTAQPVVIRNTTTKEVEFVLLHNGTITNYLDLKKKLNNVPEHFTDSQIMAYRLYYHGTKVFKEYEGAGMFITIDYRQNSKYPTVNFFKGGSKENSWSKIVEEERPLFLLHTNNGIWFSSIARPLILKAHGTKFQVEKLPVNTVYSYVKAQLVNEEVIDRSEMIQKKPVYAAGYNRTYYNDDDYGVSASAQNQNINKSVYTSKKESIIKYTDAFPIMSVCQNVNADKVEFIRGLYTFKNGTFTGMKRLSDYGFIPNNPLISIHFEYYFFLGVLVYGRNVLDALIKFQKDFQISDTDMMEQYSHIVYNYAHQLKYEPQTKECYLIKDFDAALYNGTYFPLFNPTYPQEYTIKEGKINSYVEKSYTDSNKEGSDYVKQCEKCNILTADEYLEIFINNMK